MNDSTCQPITITPGDEWGIFNDEGCVEAELRSADKVRSALLKHRAEGDEFAYAARMCPDHHEHPADTCEECHAEEVDEDA